MQPDPEALAPAPPSEPRFWTRPDGGTLAWDEYGDPQGRPVFYFHGWPSSRLQGSLLHGPALRHGLRVICPDRPGVGALHHRPGAPSARLASLARCLRRASRSRTLRCGRGFGWRALRACHGGGAAPPREFGGRRLRGRAPGRVTRPPADRSGVPGAHALPEVPPVLLSPVFSFARWVSTFDPAKPPFSWFMKMVPPEDREAVLANPQAWPALLGSFREAFRQGAAGVMMDADLFPSLGPGLQQDRLSDLLLARGKGPQHPGLDGAMVVRAAARRPDRHRPRRGALFDRP